VWIGLWEPSTDLLQRVQAQLGLHYLAIEDAGKAHQHPKIEQYGEAVFVVARTAQLIDTRIAFGETHLFVGRDYVVSVRHGASSSYAVVRERCESCPTSLPGRRLYPLTPSSISSSTTTCRYWKRSTLAGADSAGVGLSNGSSVGQKTRRPSPDGCVAHRHSFAHWALK